ncbi:MAG: hypothetical protein BGP06_09420 [Rhizobiales bacterium 65-9]|nr:MAG: hypothetical protein BGP06_09420 [Rhizobiales bacterium 65-9]
MIPVRVYAEDWEIDSRLVPFGVTRAELLEITRAVVAARSDAVADDPASAEGLFAYIYGTRGVRRVFRAKGWIRHRHENIESVRHPDRPLQIVYQSVDLASSNIHTPLAVSGKGSGADRIIDEGQGCLFVDEKSATSPFDPINSGVWFFCVSVNGDDVRAELSLPAGVSGGNFNGFIERIFIIRDGEWAGIHVTESGGLDPTEFEPVVSRKKN